MTALSDRKAISAKFISILALAGVVCALVFANSLGHAVGDTTGATESVTSTSISDTSEEEWPDQEFFQDLSEAEREGVLRTARMAPTFLALSKLSGFVDGGSPSSDPDALLIYWHGDLTEEAESVLAEAAQNGIEVTVEFLDYSVEEIERTADQLILEVEGLGLEIHKLSILRGYTEIQLVVDDYVSDEQFARAKELVEDRSGGLPITLLREPRDEGAIIFPALTR